MIVTNRCLVIRGVDVHDRFVVCLQDATVEISARLMRRREVCARCASEMFDLHMGDYVKMKLLPKAMGMLLR